MVDKVKAWPRRGKGVAAVFQVMALRTSGVKAAVIVSNSVLQRLTAGVGALGKSLPNMIRSGLANASRARKVFALAENAVSYQKCSRASWRSCSFKSPTATSVWGSMPVARWLRYGKVPPACDGITLQPACAVRIPEVNISMTARPVSWELSNMGWRKA